MDETIEQKKAVLEELTSPWVFGQDDVSIAIEMAVRGEVGSKIYSMARSLLQAMEAIDGQKTSTGPNDLVFHIQRVNSRLGPDRFYSPDFHLSDIEDLYYAVCGKIKDLIQCAEIHLQHGFTNPDGSYIHVGGCDASNVGSVSLRDFMSTLIATEAMLYNSEIVEPLNKAILRKNMLFALKRKTDLLITDHDLTQHPPTHKRPNQFNSLGAYNAKAAFEAQGLQDMRGRSCAMIFAALSERYHAIEVAERAREKTMRRLQRVQFYREQALRKLCGGSFLDDSLALPGGQGENRRPHDLTSRMKKLEQSKALEYPCLCDPDCLCAPLCAGEPEENCLCETNPLFWRVTTGFEIEELLYRAKDELYPFKTRYNRLAQLTLSGIDTADILCRPSIAHTSSVSIIGDRSTSEWYRVTEQRLIGRTAG